MKPSVIQAFLRDWLGARGLAPDQSDPDTWSFSVPKDLRDRLGSAELTFSFNRRALARHPRAELATVGNPVFDRLLAVAREEGRVGVGFVHPPAHPSKPPSPEKAGSGIGHAFGAPLAVYQPVYHFLFTITYPSIEAADEMELVSVDGATTEVWAQTPDLMELWDSLEDEPRKGRTVLPSLPVTDGVLHTARRALERRMRRRIKKVEQTSRQRLDEETASITTYYEQLIEEARNQSRRWSTKVEDREERIRWLQLEWKRRIEEANEFWRPHVDARLVALGLMMQPRHAYPLLSGPKARKGAPRGPYRIWDDATKQFLSLACDACGRTALTEARPSLRGGWECLVCPDRPVDPPEPAEGNGEGKDRTGKGPKEPKNPKAPQEAQVPKEPKLPKNPKDPALTRRGRSR